MKRKTLLLTLAFGLAATAVCLAGDTKAEQALRDADDAWSKAAASKDLDKTVSYYSADARVLPPNAPIATTKEAIESFGAVFFASPVSSSVGRQSKSRSQNPGILVSLAAPMRSP